LLLKFPISKSCLPLFFHKSFKDIPVLEHHRQPVAPLGVFILRIAKSVSIAFFIVAIALSIGVLAYHYIENFPWVDAILNAAMILGGMGPVGELHTTSGKLFASAYALFSGLIFMIVAAILFAPILHRFLHRFHLEFKE
jgi:hypothetical protein